MMSVTFLTMLLQMQNISISRIVLLETSLDLLDNTGIFPTSNDQEELVVKRLSDDDYRGLVRSLSETQKQFIYHVLHSIKTKSNL